MENKELLMDMLGFGCASCAYTLEKFGRKVEGVIEIHVSLAEKLVRVTYNGDRAAIVRQLIDIVHRIGHDICEHVPEPAD